jgi:hypothetical protein
MNDSTLSIALPAEEPLLVDEEISGFGPSGPDLISDDDIDYRAIAINSQPGRPGGRIVFDTADYATDEEAMAAMEALFMTDMEEDDHDLTAQA